MGANTFLSQNIPLTILLEITPQNNIQQAKKAAANNLPVLISGEQRLRQRVNRSGHS